MHVTIHKPALRIGGIAHTDDSAVESGSLVAYAEISSGTRCQLRHDRIECHGHFFSIGSSLLIGSVGTDIISGACHKVGHIGIVGSRSISGNRSFGVINGRVMHDAIYEATLRISGIARIDDGSIECSRTRTDVDIGGGTGAYSGNYPHEIQYYFRAVGGPHCAGGVCTNIVNRVKRQSRDIAGICTRATTGGYALRVILHRGVVIDTIYEATLRISGIARIDDSTIEDGSTRTQIDTGDITRVNGWQCSGKIYRNFIAVGGTL